MLIFMYLLPASAEISEYSQNTEARFQILIEVTK